MRFRNALDGVFGRGSRVTLLRLLVRTRGERTGREWARLAGLDHKTCHSALQGLARQGVVSARRMGNAVIYRLKDDHALVRGIIVPAFDREERLVEEYADEACREIGEKVEAVVLYGSVARGDEEETSDVDLLFLVRDEKVARAAQARVADVMSSLARRYGSVPQIVVATARRFREGVRRGLPLFVSILQAGRVLQGMSFSEILENGGKEDRHAKRA